MVLPEEYFSSVCERLRCAHTLGIIDDAAVVMQVTESEEKVEEECLYVFH